MERRVIFDHVQINYWEQTDEPRNSAVKIMNSQRGLAIAITCKRLLNKKNQDFFFSAVKEM